MNIDTEAKRKKHDKWKLRYAYIIFPLLITAQLAGQMQSELYRKYGDKAIGEVQCGYIFMLVVIDYLPIILPSTVIRFGYFKRALNYSLELFISMWSAITISLSLFPFLIGQSIGTLGLLGTPAVYCVLSYKATGYNDMLRKTRCILTLLTLAMPFIIYKILGLPTIPGLFLFYEAPFIAIMINCHLPQKSETAYSSASESQEYSDVSSNRYEDTSKYSNTRENIAIKLVNLGLACIGRKTKRNNLFMTKEHDTERHKVEYAFLRKLAEKYRDAGTRKILAKHFMLYKETCLYIIFSLLLNNDVELHNLVKQELTSSLNDGLTPEVAAKRKDYMYAFSKAFYDEYKKNHNLTLALNNMFWGVASDKYTDIVNSDELSVIMIDGSLLAIYKYELSIIKNALDIH